jgi:iron complex outermembrane receptor protein
MLSFLKRRIKLDEIVVAGTRTVLEVIPLVLPIDVISSKDLASTGQATFDKALQYKIPSFNTVQTPVNDANVFIRSIRMKYGTE